MVDNEEALRAVVRDLLERYRQPALVEDYIAGREFTVGLLGDKRPRVLPPMEIVFQDKDNQRPVYDYQIKQEWEKHVYYECPAKLTPAELKGIERVCRETFDALDCRDVARVDLRMNAKGEIYVLEVNPLPGLTPDYSDLCLIAKAADIEYRSLIGEILAGGLKRLREKRRAEAAKSGTAASAGGAARRPCPVGGRHRQRQRQRLQGCAAQRRQRRPPAPRTSPASPAPEPRRSRPGGKSPSRSCGRTDAVRRRLRDLGFSIGRLPAGAAQRHHRREGRAGRAHHPDRGRGAAGGGQGPGAHRRHRDRARAPASSSSGRWPARSCSTARARCPG